MSKTDDDVIVNEVPAVLVVTATPTGAAIPPNDWTEIWTMEELVILLVETTTEPPTKTATPAEGFVVPVTTA